TSTSTSLRDELPKESLMSVKLDALIAKTESAIDGEADAVKKRKLVMRLATLEETKRLMGDDPDDDKGDEGDEDDEDSKSKKAAETAAKMKAKHAAMGHRAKAAEHKAKAAELEEKAKKCEEEASGGEEDEGDEDEKKSSEAL